MKIGVPHISQPIYLSMNVWLLTSQKSFEGFLPEIEAALIFRSILRSLDPTSRTLSRANLTHQDEQTKKTNKQKYMSWPREQVSVVVCFGLGHDFDTCFWHFFAICTTCWYCLWQHGLFLAKASRGLGRFNAFNLSLPLKWCNILKWCNPSKWNRWNHTLFEAITGLEQTNTYKQL